MTRMSLSLYVAGDDADVRELVSVVQGHLNRSALADQYLLEVVDVLSTPERALEQDVFATPTLVRHSPLPMVKLIGDFRQVEQLISLIQSE